MAQAEEGAEQYLPAARTGCSKALGQLLEAARRYLLWIARQEMDPGVQSKAGPSDLVQETLLEAHRDFASFHGETEAEWLAWLRRLLFNNLSNFTRRYRDTAKRRLDQEVTLDSGSPADAVAASAPAPVQQIIAEEQGQLLARAIEHLPDDYREIIRLWYQEQHSFEEIGKLQGRTGNAIRMKWSRAIRQLQRELEALP
jgi:RNA polymerase sigma-70 factor (ECF subfamily)